MTELLMPYRTDTVDQAVARACLEPTLTKALNWIAIWETERVVKQVLEWQRTGVPTGSNGGAWDTCFEFCFEQVMDKWVAKVLAGTAPAQALSVREACRRRQSIDAADAQALEHALTITERERDEAKSDAYVRALLIASGAVPPEGGPMGTWTPIGFAVGGPSTEPAALDMGKVHASMTRAVRAVGGCGAISDNGNEACLLTLDHVGPHGFAPSPAAQPDPVVPLAWDDDRPLPEDEAIDAAFPTRSGRHDTYQEAMRMVGAKRSKGALVALVNWLLIKAEGTQK